MSVFSRLSLISRQKKIQMFYDLMKPTAESRILDVGGEIDPDGNRTLQLIDSCPWRQNLYTINIDEHAVAEVAKHYPEVKSQVASALEIPWPDNYFDVVYCNAVIEHVGDYQAQKKMASEIMRVAKRWFVTTPNRRYPYEFHIRLPFVTWLPFHGYVKFARLICYNHVKKKYVFGTKIDYLRLMTANELHKCFPGSRIIKQRVTFMPETLIAVGEKE